MILSDFIAVMGLEGGGHGKEEEVKLIQKVQEEQGEFRTGDQGIVSSVL